ncbi:uncharacterized protein LOC119113794 [Pollicipes pollicipes]|uniref:uncharacterized protein LOC119113794 n=1 Tax=Pollicipes pollicipes TaxID=41117 RepID=UPI001884F072|nr:uncharacterized protein LOC119113794 [Pollicipes pollicipes]
MPLFFPLGSATALEPGVKSTLLFLWHLAWKCRMRLPVLLTVTLLVMDARMRIEINMDVDEVEDGPLVDDLSEEEEEEEDLTLGDDEEDEEEDSDEALWPLESDEELR